MEVQTHDISKHTQPFFQEKSGLLVIHENVMKIITFQDFPQNRAQHHMALF